MKEMDEKLVKELQRDAQIYSEYMFLFGTREQERKKECPHDYDCNEYRAAYECKTCPFDGK